MGLNTTGEDTTERMKLKPAHRAAADCQVSCVWQVLQDMFEGKRQLVLAPDALALLDEALCKRLQWPKTGQMMSGFQSA